MAPALLLALWAADPRLAEAERLRAQADQLARAGEYAKAIPLAEQALALRDAARGPKHPEVAESLNDLGSLYRETGDYTRALPLYGRALHIREAAFGEKHLAVAETLHDLGELDRLMGNYDQAEKEYQRALSIREAQLGPQNAQVAATLNNLGALYRQMGSYDRAGMLLLRALHIKEAILKPGDPSLATAYNSLAVLYVTIGSYAEAEPLLERTLAIREQALGPAHPSVATALNNLAQLYSDLGAYERAEPLFARSLAIREAALGREHPSVAGSLGNLVVLYRAQGQFERALPLAQRALAIDQKVHGASHPDVATDLNNLAELYVSLGQDQRAQPLLERTLAIDEATHPGAPHPDVAQSLENLANLYLLEGAHARAEPLVRRALAIREAVLGPGSRDVADCLVDLARARVLAGHGEDALPLLARALDIWERVARIVQNVATESRMAAFSRTLRAQQELLYSLAAERPHDRDAQRLALALALLGKGRALDVAADTSRAVRQGLDARDQAQFDRLRTVRGRLAGLALGGPGTLAPDRYSEQVRKLEAESEQIEKDLALRSAALGVQRALPPPAQVVARVAGALPDDAALIEVVAFRPYRFRARGVQAERWGALRYRAFALTPGEKVQAVDLGPAQVVDAAVRELLHGLTRPDADWRPAAQRLHRLIAAPFGTLVGDRKRWLLALDGQLHLVPFGALYDGRRFLIDQHEVTYLTSGRDLLRERSGDRRSHTVVVVADPQLDGALPALPGTRLEAEAIRKLLPGAQLLMGAAASEPALLALQAPGVLHVATHGWFLEDEAPPSAGTRGLHLQAEVGAPTRPSSLLLRSALVLSGARPGHAPRAASDRPDGMATALEVAGMNLWGTQLVVLSACDTGRGDVRLGQGLYGLQRALVVAGAQTLVTSLWKIDDEATRTLMEQFYRNLLGGADRAEAMRKAALALRTRRPHPYYWAPFQVLGRTGPLGGAPGAAIPPLPVTH